MATATASAVKAYDGVIEAMRSIQSLYAPWPLATLGCPFDPA